MSPQRGFLPDIVIERSLPFQLLVLVIGIVLLLSSTIMRPSYPLLWMPVFVLGGLIEGVIVFIVSAEIGTIENEISQARSDIQRAVTELDEIQDDVDETQSEIEQAKNDIFSHISKSEGRRSNSLEDRVDELEFAVGTGSKGVRRHSLKAKVSEYDTKFTKIEKQMDDLKRNLREF